MKQKGYRFLELTKMVKGDRYKYIMNRHEGADTLPLGAGAGGLVNRLAMMNPIELEKYEAGAEEPAAKQGMLFQPEYQELVRFKGDLQTICLPRAEHLYKDKEAYKSFRKQLLEHRMIYKKEGGYKLTELGIFWGNTISRHLADLI